MKTEITKQITEKARAKINLSLRILGRRGDGYHELQSLVVFADISDRLTLEPSQNYQLTLSGHKARQIEGINLIERAVEAVRTRAPAIITGTFNLEKILPVSAGIGGGSANAAAALRALKRANTELADKINWMECAASIGADVSVCYLSQSAIMQGVGERVTPIRKLPDISLVLVNSGAQISTAEIFKRLTAPPLDEATQNPAFVEDLSGMSFNTLLHHIQTIGNDLEAPAIEVCPEISMVKASIAANPGCAHVALSGSGATCFGVFPDHEQALQAETKLRKAHPQYWVKAAPLI